MVWSWESGWGDGTCCNFHVTNFLLFFFTSVTLNKKLHPTLKINEEKTELLHISSRFRTRSQLPPITFDGPPLEPSSYARNLGIMVDDQLTLKRHVGSMCRSASYAIHKIGKLRRYLDQATTEKLVHAFVMSRIDNCNSLLFGLPDSLIDKVQRVQNCAARIVSRKRKRDHITPVLYDLHWLPVSIMPVLNLNLNLCSKHVNFVIDLIIVIAKR